VSNTEQEQRAAARTERINTVNAEWRALQAWRKGGEVGERPETPNVDMIQDEAFKPIRLSVDRPAKGTRTPKASEPLIFTINGKPVRSNVNSFGELSWSGTKNLVGDAVRVKPAELVAILQEQHDIENPRFTAWGPVTLSNGVTLQVCKVDENGEPVGLVATTAQRIAKAEVEIEANLAAIDKVVAERTPVVLPVLEELMAPIVGTPKRQRASRSKEAVAERAAAKAAKAEAKAAAPKLQPRKANKPVVGIKPPTSRRKAS